MKWAIYSVVVLFLAGGVGCAKQRQVAAKNPPAENLGDKKPAEQPPAEQKIDDPIVQEKPDVPSKLTDEKTAEQTVSAPSYAKDVKPFLTTYCVQCHNSRSAKANYNFDNFTSLMKAGRRGQVLVAGNPDNSLLLRSLAGTGKKMPPRTYAKQPKPEEIAKVKAWIAAGAKDDSAIISQNDSTAPLIESLRPFAIVSLQAFDSLCPEESVESFHHE